MKSKRWKRRNRHRQKSLYRGYLYLEYWGYSPAKYYLRWVAGWGVAVKKLNSSMIELIWNIKTPLMWLG